MYPRKSDSDSSAMRGTSSISSSSEIGAAATVVLEEMEEVDLAEEAEAVDLAVVDFEADDFDEVDLVLVDAFFERIRLDTAGGLPPSSPWLPVK